MIVNKLPGLSTTLCLDVGGVLARKSQDALLDHLEPLEGCRDFLATLRGDKVSLVVNSAHPAAEVEDWLEHHGLLEYINGGVVSPKPKAEKYLDDRMVRYKGDYGEFLEKLLDFKPWWWEGGDYKVDSVALDFDATLNTYGMPGTDDEFSGDDLLEPQDGAREFLGKLHAKVDKVLLYSVRSNTPEGSEKMEQWLAEHGMNRYVDGIETIKPFVKVYGDDRGMRFKGDYKRTLEKLRLLTPAVRSLWVNRRLGYAWILKREGPANGLLKQWLRERAIAGLREEDGAPTEGEWEMQTKQYAEYGAGGVHPDHPREVEVADDQLEPDMYANGWASLDGEGRVEKGLVWYDGPNEAERAVGNSGKEYTIRRLNQLMWELRVNGVFMKSSTMKSALRQVANLIEVDKPYKSVEVESDSLELVDGQYTQLPGEVEKIDEKAGKPTGTQQVQDAMQVILQHLPHTWIAGYDFFGKLGTTIPFGVLGAAMGKLVEQGLVERRDAQEGELSTNLYYRLKAVELDVEEDSLELVDGQYAQLPGEAVTGTTTTWSKAIEYQQVEGRWYWCDVQPGRAKVWIGPFGSKEESEQHYLKSRHRDKSADTQRVMAMANDYWHSPTVTGLNAIKQAMLSMSQQDANALVRKLVPGVSWGDDEDQSSAANEVYYALLARAKPKAKSPPWTAEGTAVEGPAGFGRREMFSAPRAEAEAARLNGGSSDAEWDEIKDKGVGDTVAAAGRWAADKWAWLENRYGRWPARAMVLAMLASMPLPGNITAIIAAAEAIRGIHSMVSNSIDGDARLPKWLQRRALRCGAAAAELRVKALLPYQSTDYKGYKITNSNAPGPGYWVFDENGKVLFKGSTEPDARAWIDAHPKKSIGGTAVQGVDRVWVVVVPDSAAASGFRSIRQPDEATARRVAKEAAKDMPSYQTGTAEMGTRYHMVSRNPQGTEWYVSAAGGKGRVATFGTRAEANAEAERLDRMGAA